jgi:hypothetical protein
MLPCLEHAPEWRPCDSVSGWLAVIAKRLSAFVVIGLALAYAGCGGGDLTLPSEGEPAAIAIEHGDNQQARVGARLADSLVVKVTDTQSRPVAGAAVNFAFDDAAAGGIADPAQAVTDPNGMAWSRLTLGTHVGAATGSASVSVPDGQVPVTTAFTATALPADANGIALVSGQDQSGPVGSQLGQPLVVQVTDGFGNPIQGVPVSWSTGNGGSLTESSTTTGEDGKTSVTWTLGPTAGAQTASASAGQPGSPPLAGSPVTFNATATAGNAATITKLSGDDQRGAPGSELPLPLVVQVLDAQGNPVINRAVAWVGDGTANPETSNTDTEGKASTRWTISATPGRNTLNAVVSGVGRVTFHATGSNSASTTSITAMSPDRSLVGQAVTVSVRVSGSGGTPTGTVTVNGESAAQPCTITLSGGTGSCAITFTAPGNHKVTASYAGDATFGGSSDEANHQVDPVNQNQPPHATDDAYSTNEDVSLHVPSEGAPILLDNDSDPDGENLRVEQLTQPAHGQVANFTNLGGFDYTPEPNFNGEDSFTYRVIDGKGAADTATVRITVTPVNDAPVAQNDGPYSTPGLGAPLTVDAPGVLGNDSDPDGQTLQAQNPSTPSQGSVTLGQDGSFTYFPSPGATGTDSFTYEASDGALTSSATVTINIQ